jgi:hypothetical protein
LGAKDAVTPLKAVLVGAVVNIIGDIILVSVCNKGVAGAAAATTLSQILGALYLLYVAICNLPKTSNDQRFFSWEALKKYVFFPRWKDVVSYLTFCGAVELHIRRCCSADSADVHALLPIQVIRGQRIHV